MRVSEHTSLQGWLVEFGQVAPHWGCSMVDLGLDHQRLSEVEIKFLPCWSASQRRQWRTPYEDLRKLDKPRRYTACVAGPCRSAGYAGTLIFALPFSAARYR